MCLLTTPSSPVYTVFLHNPASFFNAEELKELFGDGVDTQLIALAVGIALGLLVGVATLVNIGISRAVVGVRRRDVIYQSLSEREHPMGGEPEPKPTEAKVTLDALHRMTFNQQQVAQKQCSSTTSSKEQHFKRSHAAESGAAALTAALDSGLTTADANGSAVAPKLLNQKKERAITASDSNTQTAEKGMVGSLPKSGPPSKVSC